MLLGMCRYCKEKISWQYPLVELATGLLFLVPALLLPVGIQSWYKLFYYWLIILFLIFIFVYDYKYQEISDWATLPLAGLLFLNYLIFDRSLILSGVLGAVGGAGLFFLQYVLSRGRWIGGGDIRLGLLMGVILGWPNILLSLGLAYVLGAIVSVFLLSFKKKKISSEIPFGTFLTIATFIAMFWGNKIVGWYVSLLH
jgi:prepilin signal peptidase PulO-like enzyme (type II secretory pathway)